MLKRNNTSFPIHLSDKIQKIYERYKNIEKPFLLFHQYLVREYFIDPTFGLTGERDTSRGLLIWHQTGIGKTILAVSVMIALMDIKQPVLLIPKSLHQNFLDTIDKLIEDRILADKIKSRLNFVSMDAYNSSAQLKAKSGTLNNKLLIVDEAHNFFKAIINSGEASSNAKIMYNMIMSAVDLKILFLSGSPITKDPFELACAVNMLTGTETLPSNYDTFEEQYIEKRLHIKNKNKLQNRLFGLVSYVRSDLPNFPGDDKDKLVDNDRPKDLGITVEKIEMSKDQYLRYVSIRDREDKLSMKKKSKRAKSPHSQKMRDTPNMSLPSSGKGTASYYIESRTISNFAPPLEIANEDAEKIDDSYFTKDNSPKMFRLVQNLKKGKKPALVYSQFIKGGLNAIVRYLKLEGFVEWLPSEYGQQITHKLRFAVISGKVPPADRPLVVKTFNDGSNMYGDVISVLLVSKTGAEGLDLKHIREVHILEPYWDMARIIQIQGRAIRKGSHSNLPETDRNVKTIIYVSVENKETSDKVKLNEDTTIDMQFLIRSQKKMNLIKEFEKAIKEVSIECIVNNYDNCRVCLPDNVPLFNSSDVSADIDDPNDPCRTYTTESKVKVRLIEYEGSKFYYKENNESPFGYDLFVYDEKLEGYTEFPLNNPKVLKIINSIK